MTTTSTVELALNDIVSLCKRRGFVFPSSELYGGFAASWDYAPLGVELKNNIKRLWWDTMVTSREDVVGMDCAVTMNPRIWEASGHVESFHDPMVVCKTCGYRFREDNLDEEYCPKKPSQKVKECEGELTPARNFNLMFKIHWGPTEDEDSISYLRPETCQPLFTNFRNITTTMRVRVPFGIAQIGKAFRNEITTKSFVFRQREFEQMEMEFFCHPDGAAEWYEKWRDVRLAWHRSIGLNPSKLRCEDHPPDKLAHYAKAALDIEYQFPMGWGEIEGVHNRGDWDLSRHSQFSGKNLEYRDDRTGEKYIPFCVETSAGLDRTFLALLCDAYDEDEAPDEKGNMEKRIVLRFRPKVAPITVAVFPLSKKPELLEISGKIETELRETYNFRSMHDVTGSIGKRYRRQDEIGTPLCITVDFDSLEDKAVTIRHRDTMEQIRVPIENLPTAVADQIRDIDQSFNR